MDGAEAKTTKRADLLRFSAVDVGGVAFAFAVSTGAGVNTDVGVSTALRAGGGCTLERVSASEVEMSPHERAWMRVREWACLARCALGLGARWSE